MSKDMEGGNKQRRRLARQAEKDGKRPSEVGLTLGASKQRHRVRRKRGHKERLLAIRRGKQEVTSANRPEPRPGSHPEGPPPEWI